MALQDHEAQCDPVDPRVLRLLNDRTTMVQDAVRVRCGAGLSTVPSGRLAESVVGIDRAAAMLELGSRRGAARP